MAAIDAELGATDQVITIQGFVSLGTTYLVGQVRGEGPDLPRFRRHDAALNRDQAIDLLRRRNRLLRTRRRHEPHAPRKPGEEEEFDEAVAAQRG